MDLQPSTLSRPSNGRNAPRSSNGCWTCRVKKVKCDEARPQCCRCLRLKLLCDYRPKKKISKVELVVNSLQRHNGERSSLSTICMLGTPPTSASSVALSATDHEAIRYFRTTFARLHHTKKPEYSMYSIMFRLAEDCPVVMHMVLAVGGQEMEIQRNLRPVRERGPASPLWHYSRALGLMACMIGSHSQAQLNFESIYTALWLMLLYEQKNGDGKCAGLIKHLHGASLVLKHLFGERGLLSPPAVSGAHQQLPAPISRSHGSRQNNHLSLYAARLIMWMVQVDIAAATSGVGGQLHTTLCKLFGSSISTADRQTASYNQMDVLDRFEQLHHFSNPLYRSLWGADYPQSELLHDVENRNIFFFEGACTQLRFMVAQLAEAKAKVSTRLEGCSETGNISDHAEAIERQVLETETSISSVSNRFGDLIDVASSLSLTTDNTHKLVANLRRVVPFFYAVVLYFLRVSSGPGQKRKSRSQSQSQATQQRQTEAVHKIVNLAFQAHKHDGKEAMARIAWPLFMAAVETEDPLQREWLLSQFNAISKCGLHLDRAYRFLVHVVDLQGKAGERVDMQAELASGAFDLFVIY